jgi:hypothetical protein
MRTGSTLSAKTFRTLDDALKSAMKSPGIPVENTIDETLLEISETNAKKETPNAWKYLTNSVTLLLKKPSGERMETKTIKQSWLSQQQT